MKTPDHADIPGTRVTIERIATKFNIYFLLVISLCAVFLFLSGLLMTRAEFLDGLPEGAMLLTVGTVGFCLFFPWFTALYFARHLLISVKQLEVELQDLHDEQGVTSQTATGALGAARLKRDVPRMKKLSRRGKIAGLGCAAIVCASVVALAVVGAVMPDTAVCTGPQIPKRFVTTIRSLDLLEEGEAIRYFYSDAVFDIEAGLYFVTDQKLVLYSSGWEEPEIIIPLNEITSLHAVYDDSFLGDSMIYVTTHAGMEVSFPLSSYKGGDRRFVEAIKQKADIEQDAPTDAAL